MFLMVLILALQTQANQGLKPQAPLVQPFPPTSTEKLKGTIEKTTPALSLDSPAVSFGYQIGTQMGGQGEAVGELKSKVEELRDNRKADRLDIDNLITSRRYAFWLVSFALAAIGALSWSVTHFRVFLVAGMPPMAEGGVARKSPSSFIGPS